jgi:hypothetical protein
MQLVTFLHRMCADVTSRLAGHVGLWSDGSATEADRTSSNHSARSLQVRHRSVCAHEFDLTAPIRYGSGMQDLYLA